MNMKSWLLWTALGCWVSAAAAECLYDTSCNKNPYDPRNSFNQQQFSKQPVGYEPPMHTKAWSNPSMDNGMKTYQNQGQLQPDPTTASALGKEPAAPKSQAATWAEDNMVEDLVRSQQRSDSTATALDAPANYGKLETPQYDKVEKPNYGQVAAPNYGQLDPAQPGAAVDAKPWGQPGAGQAPRPVPVMEVKLEEGSNPAGSSDAGGGSAASLLKSREAHGEQKSAP